MWSALKGAAMRGSESSLVVLSSTLGCLAKRAPNSESRPFKTLRNQHLGARLELQTCVAGCIEIVFFFMRWHEVAFVKNPGPLYAPPESVNDYGVALMHPPYAREATT